MSQQVWRNQAATA